MKRSIFQELTRWAAKPQRKPLILRGARQVGKTHIVQELGEQFDHVLTVNFEKQPQIAQIFTQDLDVRRITRDLALLLNEPIIPQKTLLFFAEIQQAPQALTALRYFYEDYPELHVIAAGSLLDFAIEQVGIPVGRVEFLYLYPMSFMEFLAATGRQPTAEAILQQKFSQPFSSLLHEQCLRYVAEYLAIGGMPEVVKMWCETQDLIQCNRIKNNLLEAYRQDFEKYGKKHQIKYIHLLFDQVPRCLGNTFKFSKVPGEYRKRELAPSLELLIKAQVVKPIYYSAGQGLPLGAQADLNLFKALFVDVALAQSLLGYQSQQWLLQVNNNWINKGEIVESFVGQELLAYADPYVQTPLFYWQRQERSSNAEVDYLIERIGKVIPIEVKSGAGTTLKSMHSFLSSHPHSPYGIRFSALPLEQQANIYSYPLYAIASLFQNTFPA